MFETLSAYWQYLKFPRLIPLSKNRKSLWKDLCWLFVLDFVFALAIILTYYILLKSGLIRKYEEFDIFKFGFPTAMFLGVVFAPVTEELIFRWQLREPKASVWFVIISAAVLICSFIKNDYARFFIVVGFLVVGLVTVTLTDKMKRLRAIHIFRRYYVFLFYYTAVIFGYLHISNMKGLTLSDPSFIIYISSQIFGGLTIGYIRVKYGLKYGMLFHAIFNAVMLPLSLLMT